jgi:hypothetical protein
MLSNGFGYVMQKSGPRIAISRPNVAKNVFGNGWNLEGYAGGASIQRTGPEILHFSRTASLSRKIRPGDEFFVVRLRYVEINFDESSAVRFAPGGKIYGIQVALNDLEELLPPEQIADQESPSATKAWVAAEVDRMKDKGELSKYRGTTALAKELERRRNKAADTNKSIKPVRWPYIKNILYELDLTSIVKRI